MDEKIELVLGEISEVLRGVSPDAVDVLAEAVMGAPRVFLAGLGRSGLMAGAFAMRLMHLGLLSHVMGEVTAPAIGQDDLLVACSGSGATETVVMASRTAHAAGAKVLAVTGAADSPLASAADAVVVLPFDPSRRPAGGQFGGCAFEQSLLIFFDAVVLSLMQRLGQTHSAMHARHANLDQ